VIGVVRDLAIVACLVAGLFFTFVSTAGVVRLPDVYSRAHTASQADTLGAGFALAGVALALGVDTTSIKTVLLLFFIFVTNPTAAHAITRAAHEEGIEPWSVDDDRSDGELYAAASGQQVTDGGPVAGEGVHDAETTESGEVRPGEGVHDVETTESGEVRPGEGVHDAETTESGEAGPDGDDPNGGDGQW
jgi:multicomponent Na+:H+ antiporter subunit G